MCSCHISPPCSECTSQSECEVCGRLTPNEDTVEHNEIIMCTDCHASAQSDGVLIHEVDQ